VRRAVDLLLAIPLLVLSLPVMIVAAVAVKLSSPGPVFYRAERVGRGGRPFAMLKFRTMVVDADRVGPRITTVGDPRVTRVGDFLRATKLDELPQLFNVVAGDLTLIGPRAEDPRFVARYTPEQKRLLEVRPGLTGPGQLYYSTDQEQEVTVSSEAEDYYVEKLLADKLERDLDYLEHRSWAEDLRILARTVRVALAGLVRGIGRLARRSARPTAGRPSGRES
jgi:lipopolysaccharide/colanic/teichoic acid biosynthesis glycosyltransferase